MTDRELLELAAKAARMVYRDDLWDGGHVQQPDGLWKPWRPLTDDGDALRLAVKLRISIEHPNPYDDGGGFVTAYVRRAYYRYALKEDLFFNETLGDDRDAATRRAIVRAAAEIGAATPKGGA